MKKPPPLTKATEKALDQFAEAALALGADQVRHVELGQPFPSDDAYNAAKTALEKRIRWLEARLKRLNQQVRNLSGVIARAR